MQPLANKYRPKTFDDVSEQSAIKQIIENQIANDDLRNAYLFCGGAGTGKTTCARIVANMINNGEGKPIELDAASNNSVDDVRRIITDSKFKSMDSKYKVYIIDECHSLSNSAWQAFLKLLEEPSKYTIFIFCTTDPQKIPGTILSRTQRYNFQRISTNGIITRLKYIISNENKENGQDITFEEEALIYIAKSASGGMRDAITTLDKCLSFSKNLTLVNVVDVLSNGITVYDFEEFTHTIMKKDNVGAIELLNKYYMSGTDMNLFLNNYFDFLLDIQKFLMLHTSKFCSSPLDVLEKFTCEDSETIRMYLQKLFGILSSPKRNVKSMMEAWVIERCY